LRRRDPDRLPDHIDVLYRGAFALCGSRHDAEDLVQETFARVLKRARFVRRDREGACLLRALRNTHYSRYRAAGHPPPSTVLVEDIASAAPETGFHAREITEAIATAPAPYRDAVIAVDLFVLSYGEAARSLRNREATIATPLHGAPARGARSARHAYIHTHPRQKA
jgi:RNA polymerase sigma-70 factor (ECF subfamily)